MDSFYDQSRHDSFSMSRIRLNQHDLSDRTTCISPVAEDGKMRNPQRRRVAVACGRCRRRKIKCSGENDGQGCSNCRIAGNTDCQFLRVNSSNVIPQGTGWPYPNPTGGPVVSPRLRMYTPSKPLLSMGSPQRMPFQRPPDFDLAENHVFPRTVGLDTLHYEDEQGENCQSSVYVLPNAPSNLTPSSMIDYGTPSWNPKAWESIVNRSNGAIYEETQPNYSYILPSQGISSTEIPQTTAAVAMNSSDIPGPERTLPTPTTRQQVPNSLNASMFEGLTVPSDFKASGAPPFYPQRTERYTLPSNAPPFTTSPPPKTEAPDLLFPYLTSTTDDTPATSAVISPSYTMESSDFPDVRLRSFREQGQRLLNLSNECMPDVYGYSSSEKKRTDECGATLVSGLPYTRVRHADTPVFPCGLLPEALEFGRPAEMHRPSVEPLGNQGAY